ncbi:MAG TPA: histidine kinase [Thermoleophilaceae bacterium]|jgi:two-component system sensor histidine kinase UhpB
MTRATPRRYTPLFWRIFLINAAVLAAASTVAVFVLSPGTISQPVAVKELTIFAAALAVMIVVNLLVTRRVTAPLDELVGVMRRIDPAAPGQRVSVPGGPSEALELADSFNDMLGRLERERLESARRALRAQEAERLRVAQELHDEVGQNLTAALLQLGRLRKAAPEELRAELGEAAETVRANLDELRRIAQALRPQDLDELGLLSALSHFTERLTEQTGLPIGRRLSPDLPALTPEQELVIYRVAQEALTNVVRHADASSATLRLAPSGERVALRVSDDGRGIDGAGQSGGIRGMRERALLIHADLDVRERPEGGTEVVLDLPAD